eukprot:m.182452 g.182452  ORF g.182452 m.182452 type:complete len:167 (+) comp14669_c0_seq1:3442-3942(+)
MERISLTTSFLTFNFLYFGLSGCDQRLCMTVINILEAIRKRSTLSACVCCKARANAWRTEPPSCCVTAFPVPPTLSAAVAPCIILKAGLCCVVCVTVCDLRATPIPVLVLVLFDCACFLRCDRVCVCVYLIQLLLRLRTVFDLCRLRCLLCLSPTTGSSLPSLQEW